MTLLFILTAVAALMSVFVLKVSSPLALPIAIIAVAAAVLNLVLLRKSRFKLLFSSVAALILLCICLLLPAGTTSYGYRDRQKMASDYTDALLNEQEEKAAEYYTALTEKYGESDYERYISGLQALSDRDFNKARNIAQSMEDHTSVFYYQIMEDVYRGFYSDITSVVYNLCPLYQEASDHNPGWTYASKNAGILLLYYDKHDLARYYLTRAYISTEQPDGEICYYLGAAIFAQGDYENAFLMFEEAVNIGVNEEL